MRRLLGEGHEAWIVDRRRSDQYPHLTRLADVRSEEQLRLACRGADVLYQLAAEHRDDVSPVSLYYDVNVAGAEAVARAAADLNISKIVFTSTVAVYGLPAGEVDERSPVRPFNHYGRSKLEAEGVFADWCEARPDRTLVVVRPTVVFGEFNRGNVYNLVRQIETGRFAMIGRGGNRKSLAYVENVAAFLDFVRELPPGPHLFNYADKPDLSVAELVRTIDECLGVAGARRLRLPYAVGYVAGAAFDAAAWAMRRKFPISRVRVKKFCANTRFAATRAQAAGFVPPVDLADGIRRFIAHDFRAAPLRRAA